jgi:hypothetical protein
MTSEMAEARDAAWEKDKRKYRYDDTVTEPTIAMPCYHDGFDAGYATRGSQWVAVTDRQPPSDIAEIYLASTSWGGLDDVEILTFDGKQWGEWPTSARIRDDVVAWMPLPEPYTADSGQEGE